MISLSGRTSSTAEGQAEFGDVYGGGSLGLGKWGGWIVGGLAALALGWWLWRQLTK